MAMRGAFDPNVCLAELANHLSASAVGGYVDEEDIDAPVPDLHALTSAASASARGDGEAARGSGGRLSAGSSAGFGGGGKGGVPAGHLPAGHLPAGGLSAGGLSAGALLAGALPAGGVPADGVPARSVPAVARRSTGGLAVSDEAPTIGSSSSSDVEESYHPRRALLAGARAAKSSGACGADSGRAGDAGADAGAGAGAAASVGSVDELSAPTRLLRDAGREEPRRSDDPEKRLRLRLRQAEAEQVWLDEAYDAEVQRCAELREELEALEAQEASSSASAAGNGRVEKSASDLEEERELRSAERLLEKALMEDGQSAMLAEDLVAWATREAALRIRESRDLERRLVELEARRLHLLRLGDGACLGGSQEALAPVDRELCNLQLSLERDDVIIDRLSEDLRNVIHYIITTNIDAAGGPSADLGPDEFLPQEVREHLSLSEYGLATLQAADRKFAHAMVQSGGSKKLATDSGLAPQVAAALSGPPLIVAELLEEGTSCSYADFEDTLYRLHTCDAADVPQLEPAMTLAEELQGLDALLQDELRALSPLVAAAVYADEAAVAANVEKGQAPSPAASPVELLRAGARGDQDAVRELLAAMGYDSSAAWAAFETFLGWTPLHAAALRGHLHVLETTKQYYFDRGEHHVPLLERRTAAGFTALGVACLSGQVAAVSSLIRGMAPVDSQEPRGCQPLHLAVASSAATEIVSLLVGAHANVGVRTGRGHQLDLNALFAQQRDGDASSNGFASAANVVAKPAVANSVEEPRYCIRAVGASVDMAGGGSLISRTLHVLKAPVRDSAGFIQNARARGQAQLSDEESQCGVWSEMIVSYMCPKLLEAFAAGQAFEGPIDRAQCCRGLVLTVERLLFFSATDWHLLQVIVLSEIAAIVTFTSSTSLVLLRLHQGSDVLVDLPVRSRDRLVEELRLASQKFAAMWGGHDFGDGAQPVVETGPLALLLGERRALNESRPHLGTLAFLEKDVFVLLPYAPDSALLAHGAVLQFGFLDLHRSIGGLWIWRRFLFFLCGTPGETDCRLLWCLHPCDAAAVGGIQALDIRRAQPLDNPQGEACLIIDHAAGAMTLRAASALRRDEWLCSLRDVLALQAVRAASSMSPPAPAVDAAAGGGGGGF
eukprot:TRINITY_DN14142_c0_g1_i1.p1 TRINITY_DN14142_c0_g1~~TRINITY_DN14142_c0_g1_i1.p1  ORF type:complete len:1124 (+),score=285.58 TRINITY_DN14142_c0_g1_i1:299-3670(+)